MYVFRKKNYVTHHRISTQILPHCPLCFDAEFKLKWLSTHTITWKKMSLWHILRSRGIKNAKLSPIKSQVASHSTRGHLHKVIFTDRMQLQLHFVECFSARDMAWSLRSWSQVLNCLIETNPYAKKILFWRLIWEF